MPGADGVKLKQRGVAVCLVEAVVVARYLHVALRHVEEKAYLEGVRRLLVWEELAYLSYGVDDGAGASSSCKSGTDVERNVVVIRLRVLQPRHGAAHHVVEVARVVAVAQVVGDEDAAEPPSLPTYAGCYQRPHVLVDEPLVAIVDEALKARIHIEVLQHGSVHPVDAHLLGLAQVHALAHHLPTGAVVEVGRR